MARWFSKRNSWIVMSAMVVASALVLVSSVVSNDQAGAAGCAPGSTLNIVAHEDDDLLFLSPDLLRDVKSNRCVRTVFMTAGDGGGPASYWKSRENGMKAAYARMANVPNVWTQSDSGIAGHPIPVFTLASKQTVSLAFMRLPDGGVDGSGFTVTGNQSLQKLWAGTSPSISVVNGSSIYTKSTLTSTLTALMNKSAADEVRVQDYVGEFGDSDHSDHHASAYFARTAHQQYTVAHTFKGYEDYSTNGKSQNVSGSELTQKKNAYYAYAKFDAALCSSDAACAGNEFAVWLQRMYLVGSEMGGGTLISPAPVVTATPTPAAGSANVALTAQATASSENTADGQTAVKAIDGSALGYPADYTKEWATAGQGAGSWLKLTWSKAQTISRIVLSDRPNLNDQITAGSILFSDGTSILTGTLTNDGSGVVLTFPARTVTNLQFNITATSANTANVGLAEIVVY